MGKALLFDVLIAGFLLLMIASPVLAEADSPEEQAAWFMADWLVFSYLTFFGLALMIFLVALKAGAFTNIEEAKYHLLTIHEPDYYTPDWAKEELDGETGKNHPDG
jgi:hypothetical protein